MNIYLASKSPRRKELLSMLNIDFDIIESNAKETILPDLSLEEQSKHLAYLKARSVFDRTSGDRIVIGSDTLVFKDNVYYGKPTSILDAFNTLSTLSNATHQVSTGLAILIEKDGIYNEYIYCDISNVHIVEMSEKEINDWIASGKALDKAGAYSIQDEFSKFIDKIDGNYYSIIGLPIHLIYKTISNFI